jgi:hypothetical protein
MNAEEKPEDAGASRAEPIAAFMGISMWTDKFTARDPSDSFLELAAMDHSSNTNPASVPWTIESVADVRNSLAHTPVFPRLRRRVLRHPRPFGWKAISLAASTRVLSNVIGKTSANPIASSCVPCEKRPPCPVHNDCPAPQGHHACRELLSPLAPQTQCSSDALA